MKIFVVMTEEWDHSAAAPAGCYSEDGDWQETKIVKAFYKKGDAEKFQKKLLKENKGCSATDHGEWLEKYAAEEDTELLITVEEVEIG